MKTIFYGVNGDGLGHASRTLAVIERLPECQVHIFTYGKAYDYLKKLGYKHLHQIKGIMMPYNGYKINFIQLAKCVINYYFNELSGNLKYIQEQDELLKPSLYITDFEPAIARAAKLTNKKLISIDNQRILSFRDTIKLPMSVRFHTWLLGILAIAMVPKPDHIILATFYWDLIKSKYEDITLTNGFIRKDVEKLHPINGNFVLLYLRHSIGDKILSTIKDLPYRFVVFGSNDSNLKRQLASKGNVNFFELSPNFADYLVSCRCIISTAGNQLLTETRYHNKPIMAIPEPNQYEQVINAYYNAQYDRRFKVYNIKELTSKEVSNFIEWSYPLENPQTVPNGVYKAVEVIRKYL